MHVAASETLYQALTFENRYLEGEELARWEAAIELGEQGRKEIRAYTAQHYIDLLKEVRQITLNGFKQRDDAWLFEETEWWGNRRANNYFKWVHVFEDEINHRGQIRILKKNIPSE